MRARIESDVFDVSVEQWSVVAEDVQQEMFKFLSAFLSDGDDASDVGWFERIGEAHIGDDGKREYLHAGVNSDEAFRDG